MLFHSIVLWLAFFTFYTQGSLVQGQRLRDSGKLLTNLCPVLFSVTWWSTSARDKPCQIMYFFIGEQGWRNQKKKYQFSPNLDFGNFLLICISSRLFKENKFHIQSLGKSFTRTGPGFDLISASSFQTA